MCDPSMMRQQGNIFSVQVMGRYKVSNEGLRALYTRVKKVQKSFESFRIEHVLRWARELQVPVLCVCAKDLPVAEAHRLCCATEIGTK